MADGTIELNPDTLLFLNRSRVVGGRTTESRQVRDDSIGEAGREVETQTIVTIDNVPERREAEALVARAVHAIRKATSATLIGHLGPASNLDHVNAELSEIRSEAERFNSGAQSCHVEIGLIPVKIAVALGAEAIRAIAEESQGKLIALRDALRAGDVRQITNTLREAKNLATLAVGPVADGISFGIDEARERFMELKRRIKGDGTMSETPASVGKSLDLSMLESAIGMLTYNPNAGKSTLSLVA